MKTDTAFFPHDLDATLDPKIIKLRVKLGNLGYAVFWLIVEILHNGSFGPDDIEEIAYQIREDNELVKKVLNDFGLFYIENGHYTSNRIKENCARAEGASRRGKKGAGNRWDFEPSQNVQDVTEEFKKVFNKENFKISSDIANRIDNITKEGKLTFEDWQLIFQNAYRGWAFDDTNKKPTLKNILENWEAFFNDDYNLAPDLEKKAAEKEKRKRIEKEIEAEEKRVAELELQEREKAYKKVCDAKSAVKFLNKYVQGGKIMRQISSDYKEFSKLYGIKINQETGEYYV